MAQSPKVFAHIDGASHGNPGPAAYGVVMKSADGSRLAAFSHYLGKATNNVAEYQGLLAALDHALSNDYLRIHVRTDSELLALQIKGVYKVKSPGLKPLRERAQQLIARLESFSIEHVPREQNREADRLANQALDAAESGKRHRGVAPSSLAPLPERGGESGVAERRAVTPPLAPLPDRGEESGVGAASKAAGPLRTSATFREGLLEPHFQLSLLEGEVVDLEIYRKE
jgi:probable phosphoglycerate mutase